MTYRTFGFWHGRTEPLHPHSGDTAIERTPRPTTLSRVGSLTVLTRFRRSVSWPALRRWPMGGWVVSTASAAVHGGRAREGGDAGVRDRGCGRGRRGALRAGVPARRRACAGAVAGGVPRRGGSGVRPDRPAALGAVAAGGGLDRFGGAARDPVRRRRVAGLASRPPGSGRRRDAGSLCDRSGSRGDGACGSLGCRPELDGVRGVGCRACAHRPCGRVLGGWGRSRGRPAEDDPGS